MTLSVKSIFIIGFSTPILKDVALRLQESGMSIVYWQGYRDYFKTIATDRKSFPDTIFHYANDAIRNIPPREVDTSIFEPPDKTCIEKMYPYSGQAMFLIERADYTGFPLSRKRHLYYEYISFWKGMLKKFKPDAILLSDVPHDGTTYVLYALARLQNIPILITDQIGVESRTLLINDYKSSSLALRDDYESNKDKNYQVEDLSLDLREYYLKHTTPAADATPEYQKRASQRKAPFRTPTFSAVIRHILHLSFLRVTYSYLRMLLTKNEEQSLDEPMAGWRYKFIINRWIKLNRALQHELKGQQVMPDFNKKFIYIPLNIQPERTTCPQAGVWDDQLLLIETAARSLPDGWVIYVKENPNQLAPVNIFSHIYRYQGYYEAIAKLKNVYLVPEQTSTYDLINNAQAVATGTGTAGWEALLRSKPALVFSSVWYMYCDGVLRVSDVVSCQKAISAIVNGFKPDKQKVLNYLVALDRNSVRARHFRTLCYRESDYKKNDYISHEDNVKNLSLALSNAILC